MAWYKEFSSTRAFYCFLLLGALQSLSLMQPLFIYQASSDALSNMRNRGWSPSSRAAAAVAVPTLRVVNRSSSVVAVADTQAPTIFEGVKARAFASWPVTRPLPCFSPERNWQDAQELPSDSGFIYLKGFKTGSSTSSGINLRIAMNVARRQAENFRLCKSRFDHAWAHKLYKEWIPEKTFLWTVVREPTKRTLSQFFHFHISRDKHEPTDENFVKYLKWGPNNMIQDYYLKAFSLHEEYISGKGDPVAVSNQILDDYNFIGISERMDESAVALAMILRLPLADILYFSAKGNGGFDDAGGRDDHICTYIWPSFVSKGMQAYLDSDDWQEKVHWDSVFYQAANRSLDLTIDRLGRTAFEANLKKYKSAIARARGRCLNKAVFPCSKTGKLNQHTTCLWKDSGCGSECLDQVASDLRLW